MRSRIHFHSDAPFFAGCENMLVNFFNDDHFMGSYDVSFGYRYSLEYEQGLKRRVVRDIKAYPLALLDSGRLSLFGNKLSFKPFAVIVKIITQFLKCVFIAYNTVVLNMFFRKLKIDLLHINNGGYPGAYSCMSAVFAAKLAGVKRIVYVVNNVAIPYCSLGRKIDYLFDKLVGKYVSVFVTGSVYAGQELQRVLGLPSEKIKNIKNGILLRPVTENREILLKRLGVPEGRLLIAVVAVLEERKGHRYLLQAVKKLKDQGGPMPYVLIEGRGALLEHLQRYVRQEQLSDSVRFIGAEKNIADLINAVDLLILPSISNEDFPNIILEAMGFGKPVIASRISGIPEQVENMKSGILVEPKDVEGLSLAVKKFLDNRSLLKSFGGRGKEIFNKKFLASISVGNYMDLYNGLLSGGN
jgi:L-malate glycosyltransferase